AYVVVQPAALLAAPRGLDHHLPHRNDVAQLEQILRDTAAPVHDVHGPGQILHALRGNVEARVAAHNADIVPHDTPGFVPVVLEHDRIGRTRTARLLPQTDARQRVGRVKALQGGAMRSLRIYQGLEE